VSTGHNSGYAKTMMTDTMYGALFVKMKHKTIIVFAMLENALC
jgi:hypothetical protein